MTQRVKVKESVSALGRAMDKLGSERVAEIIKEVKALNIQSPTVNEYIAYTNHMSQPKHRGIPFNSTDAANNINGSKTRHMVAIKPQPRIREGVGKWIKNSKVQEIGEAQVVIDCVLSNSPYQVGDVCYMKEKVYEFGKRYTSSFDETGEYETRFSPTGKIHYPVAKEVFIIDYNVIPRTQMPMKYARFWFVLTAVEVVQVDGVWYYGIEYKQTEKPTGICG